MAEMLAALVIAGLHQYVLDAVGGIKGMDKALHTRANIGRPDGLPALFGGLSCNQDRRRCLVILTAQVSDAVNPGRQGRDIPR